MDVLMLYICYLRISVTLGSVIAGCNCITEQIFFISHCVHEIERWVSTVVVQTLEQYRNVLIHDWVTSVSIFFLLTLVLVFWCSSIIKFHNSPIP